MKTRRILCMIAILSLASAMGCQANPTIVSEPPVSQIEEAEDGVLTPKITANPSVRESEKHGLFDLFTNDIAEEAVVAEDGAIAATDGDMLRTADAAAATDDEIAMEAPAWTEEGEDIIVVDEYEESVLPQAGLLTAGEWNDNDNWGFFTNLVNTGKITLPRQYGIMPTNRVSVTVTDKTNQPVVNAKARILDGSGNVIWSGITDKQGKVYLFAPDNQTVTTLEVESQGKVQTQPIAVTDSVVDEQTNTVVWDDGYEMTFDGEGKAYPQTEVMFVVDTTGSMGDELMFLQSEFTAIAEEVGTKDTKYSINFYRDDGDEYTTKRYPFSDNIQEIQQKLNSESASGGGDLPEAVAEVLEETINDGGWSEESVKLMFMIFDAPPHDGKEEMLENAIKAAAEKGIRIIPVVSSNSDRNTELFGRCAAIATGGTYIFLTDDSGIGSSHLEPIIGEHKVEKLYDIVIRTIQNYRQ